MLFRLGRFLLYLFIFLLPWQTRYIFLLDPLGIMSDFYKGGVYSWDLVFGAMIVCFFFSKYVYRNPVFQTDKLHMTNDKWNLGTLGLFLLPFVIFLFHIHRLDVTILYWLARMVEAGFLVFFALRFRPRVHIAAWVLIVSVALSGLLGVWQFFSQAVVGTAALGIASQQSITQGVSVVENESGRWLRAYGGFSHPNILGGFLVLALILLIGEMGEASRRGGTGDKGDWISLIRRIRKIGIGLTLTLTLVLTASRSALCSFFAAGLVLVFFLRRSAREAAVVFLASAFLFGVIFSPLLLSRFRGNGRLETVSRQERLSSWETYKSIFRDQGLLGTGVGKYTQEAQKIALSSYPQPMHNVFLLALVEIGIIPLTILISLLAHQLISFSKRSIKEHKGEYRMARMFPTVHGSVFTVHFFVTGFFDHYWWTYPSAFMFALTFFLFLCYFKLLKEPKEVGICH